MPHWPRPARPAALAGHGWVHGGLLGLKMSCVCTLHLNPVRYTCPNCSNPVTFRDSIVGRHIKWVNCGEISDNLTRSSLGKMQKHDDGNRWVINELQSSTPGTTNTNSCIQTTNSNFGQNWKNTALAMLPLYANVLNRFVACSSTKRKSIHFNRWP